MSLAALVFLPPAGVAGSPELQSITELEPVLIPGLPTLHPCPLPQGSWQYPRPAPQSPSRSNAGGLMVYMVVVLVVFESLPRKPHLTTKAPGWRFLYCIGWVPCRSFLPISFWIFGSDEHFFYCIGWVPCWSFLPISFLDFWL